jgi:hypothetical protein
MHTNTRMGLPLIALTLLAACASPPPSREVDWRNGARRGEIVAFYDMAAGAPPLPACLAQLPPAEIASHRFVKLRYRHVRHMRYEVAALPASSALQVGDEVEVWPADCKAGKLSRVGRELPSSERPSRPDTALHDVSPPSGERSGTAP